MISIIVPNYNHREFLPQRLDTIFNQTFQDFEVILLDDCSTDDSWKYLKQFADHPKVSHCIRNESNSGSPFRQWKKGMDLARYEWIWIAESDDYSDCSFLSEAIKEIDFKTNLVFCKCIFVDENSGKINDYVLLDALNEYEILNSFNFMDGVEFIKNYLSFRNYILNASAVLFRKPQIFPEKMMTMKFTGDWYFWIFLLQNKGIKYISTPLNYFRFHLNTTRGWKGKKMEFVKWQENMDCFKYAFSFFNIDYLFNKDFKYYDVLIQKYLKYNRKLGFFRFSVFLPDIPLVFYYTYYKYFLLSLVKKQYAYFK